MGDFFATHSHIKQAFDEFGPFQTGLDKASAMQLAQERDIVLDIYGFGVVAGQSINPGTPVAGTTNLKLNFEAPTYVE
jgi:hypothetical protein